MQNAPKEHSAILSTFIKLPFVFKICVLSIFEGPRKTGFTVCKLMREHTTIVLNGGKGLKCVLRMLTRLRHELSTGCVL